MLFVSSALRILPVFLILQDNLIDLMMFKVLIALRVSIGTMCRFKFFEIFVYLMLSLILLVLLILKCWIIEPAILASFHAVER